MATVPTPPEPAWMSTFCPVESIAAIVVWPRIDLVAWLESLHSRSDSDDDPSHLIAQNEREAIRQKAFELSVSDFGIQQVDTSGVDLDQDVILPQLRVWHVASPHAILASIAIYDECLHHMFFLLSFLISALLKEKSRSFLTAEHCPIQPVIAGRAPVGC